MVEQRVAWDDLPEPLKQAIEARTGPIESVRMLVSDHRAWLIDWAWPTVGAAWTDPACWVLRLMASGGHTAHEAERQASRLPAFQAADPAHIDLFAAANVRLWDEIAQSSTSDWTTKMAQAAKSWAACRQVR
jgi:hypothetical protein